MGKSVVVDGIDITQRYPIEQILKWNATGRLKPIALQGWIVRADADGMVGFVPWTESTLFRTERDKNVRATFDVEEMRRDVEREHPMIRRTALKKRAAMVQRLLKTARLHGTIVGLSDTQISTMIGEPWITGVSVVTEQMLDRVSAHLLGQAEYSNKEADSKRITRAHALT